MCRFTDRTVRSGFVMAWRLATSPTRISPFLAKPTTEGVVREPSAFGMTTGSPASSTETTEFVVPRSIPTARAIRAASFARQSSAAQYRELERMRINLVPGRGYSRELGSTPLKGRQERLGHVAWVWGCPAELREGAGYARADGRSSRGPGDPDRFRGRARGPPRAPAHAARSPAPTARPQRPRRAPRRSRGIRGPRTTQALPTRAPRSDARADLLGVPDLAHDDRRGHGAAGRPDLRAPADRRHEVARPGTGRLRGRRAGRDRARGRHPGVRAPRALRREPSVGGLPDPRPDLPDHRHAVPRAGRPDRRGVRAGLVVDARVHGRVVPVHLDVRRVAAGLDVDAPLGPRRDHSRVPGLPGALEAPAHRHERDQRLLREHAPAGRPDPAPDRSREHRG